MHISPLETIERSAPSTGADLFIELIRRRPFQERCRAPIERLLAEHCGQRRAGTILTALERAIQYLAPVAARPLAIAPPHTDCRTRDERDLIELMCLCGDRDSSLAIQRLQRLFDAAPDPRIAQAWELLAVIAALFDDAGLPLTDTSCSVPTSGYEYVNVVTA